MKCTGFLILNHTYCSVFHSFRWCQALMDSYDTYICGGVLNLRSFYLGFELGEKQVGLSLRPIVKMTEKNQYRSLFHLKFHNTV